MARLIMAEIRCKCGKYVNVRMKETSKGESKIVSCWNCNREIKLQNSRGYCEGQNASTTIVLDEVTRD